MRSTLTPTWYPTVGCPESPSTISQRCPSTDHMDKTMHNIQPRRQTVVKWLKCIKNSRKRAKICDLLHCYLNTHVLGMLISFFSKNRLSFWKNRFFFDYQIWASLSRYAVGYNMPRAPLGVGVATSAAGLSDLYSLLSTRELQCLLTAERRNAPLPTEAASCLAWWTQPTELNTIVYCSLSRWCRPTFPQFAGHLSAEWAAVQRSPAAGLMFRPTGIDGLLTARGKIFIRHNIKLEWLKWK